MSSRRTIVVAAVLVIIAVPVLTLLLAVAPLHQKAAADDAAATSADSVNAAQLLRIGQLQTSRSRISVLQREIEALDAALPAKPELAALLAEIGSLSSANHVTVTSFTSSGASSSSSSASTSAATPAPSASASTSTTTTTSTSTSTTAASQAAGVVEVPVQLQVTGSLDHVRDFVGALQRATRVLGVTGVGFTQSAGEEYTADITASAYELPASTGATTTTGTTSG